MSIFEASLEQYKEIVIDYTTGSNIQLHGFF